MKKVIVTGAGGFVGRHTISLLLKKGYEVHLFFYPKLQDLEKCDNLFSYKCNLLDESVPKKTIKAIKATHLLHLAWYVEHKKFWESSENLKWVQASLNLFQNFSEQGGRRIVSTGTCAEYDWNYGYCSETITPTKANSLYGTCKNSLQQILSSYSEKIGISSAWGRLFFLYGPNEVKTRLIPYTIISLLNNECAYFTSGKQMRDFLYIKDAASALVELIDSDIQGPTNIASGKPLAIKEIINMIGTLMGKPHLIKLNIIEDKPDDVAMVLANVEKLKMRVGWKPEFPIEVGLKNTIKWWKENLLKEKK